MNTRAPLYVLVLAGGLLGAAGCQHRDAQAAGSSAPSSVTTTTAAPFASPPVLAGTADVATLAAKVKPAVVNITTIHETKMQRMDGFPFDFFGGGFGPSGPSRR